MQIKYFQEREREREREGENRITIVENNTNKQFSINIQSDNVFRFSETCDIFWYSKDFIFINLLIYRRSPNIYEIKFANENLCKIALKYLSFSKQIWFVSDGKSLQRRKVSDYITRPLYCRPF